MSVSNMSIYSQPSGQACGLRRGSFSFTVSAALSDPVLQHELKLQNPQLKAALRAAGVGSMLGQVSL
jgi:hypothetical protein